MKQVPCEISRLLEEGKFTYFCTANGSLMPHVTPMFFVYDRESNRLYLTSNRDSQKVRNLESSRYLSLAVDFRDPTNPFANNGVMVQGVASLTAIEGRSDILRMFAEKYPRFIERGELGAEWGSQEVLIEVTPKLMVCWQGPHFTRWRS